MPPENDGKTPIVPAGTGKDMFGKTQPLYAPNTFGQGSAAPHANDGQTAQPNQQQAPPGATFADLAAKKGWASPDDMAKSYANLESSHTKKSMELSDLMDARLGNQSAPQSQSGTQQSEKSYTPDEALAIVDRLIDSRVAPLREQLAIRETFKTEEDMQYAPQVAELVKKNPTIPWDVALKAVKYDTAASKLQEVNAQNQSHEAAQKEKAQAASGGNRSQSASNVQAIMSDKSIPWKEKDRIMREHFGR